MNDRSNFITNNRKIRIIILFRKLIICVLYNIVYYNILLKENKKILHRENRIFNTYVYVYIIEIVDIWRNNRYMA